MNCRVKEEERKKSCQNGKNSITSESYVGKYRRIETVGKRVQMVSEVYLLQLWRNIGEMELRVIERVYPGSKGKRSESLYEQVQTLFPRKFHDHLGGFRQIVSRERSEQVSDDSDIRLSRPRA